MYTEQQIAEQLVTIEHALATVNLATAQLLTAQDDLNAKKQKLLYYYTYNAKEELRLQSLSLTEPFIQAVNAIVGPVPYNGPASRTLFLLERIKQVVEEKHKGLSSEELIAIRILTNLTAGAALEQNIAARGDEELYVPLRDTLLDKIFEITGCDLSDLP